jgi:hypothetical protein
VTPFAAILRRAVDGVPPAVGGAFADSQGEMVDSFSRMPAHEWAVLTAHYGVVMAQLIAAFGTLHYGGAEYFIARHERIEVIVHIVDAGYFTLLAFTEQIDVDLVLERARIASLELKREMQ